MCFKRPLFQSPNSYFMLCLSACALITKPNQSWAPFACYCLIVWQHKCKPKPSVRFLKSSAVEEDKEAPLFGPSPPTHSMPLLLISLKTTNGGHPEKLQACKKKGGPNLRCGEAAVFSTARRCIFNVALNVALWVYLPPALPRLHPPGLVI